MPTYKYVGPNDHHLNAGQDTITPGDEVEFDEDDPHLELFEDYFERVESQSSENASEADSEGGEDSSPEEEEESAESDEEEAQEEAGAPFDPKDFSVSELESELEEADFSEAEYEALVDLEKDREDPDDVRTTAVDAIYDAKSE